MTHESLLTEANLAYRHIYLTPFLCRLPPDVIGGTGAHSPAQRTVRLEFGSLHSNTFVPTYETGRPRNFFQDRSFAREFLGRTGAKAGDTVIFDEVTPYHFRLSLRRASGGLVKA